MTPIRDPFQSRAGTVICADVVASAGLRVTMEMVQDLRQRPGPGIGEALPATILRHADEQTVAALAAVLHAIHDFQMNRTDFRDWGLAAAPCFLGRTTLAVALQRLAAEGAWGISPHFIPHRSQHAVSGTISQVLKIFGPNFGTGGGPGGVLQALLAGSVLLQGNRLPGVWIVATEWEPEAIPDLAGRIPPDTACHALALALVAARPGWHGVRLRVLAQGTPPGPASSKQRESRNGKPDAVHSAPVDQALPTVSQLQALLTPVHHHNGHSAKMVWPLDGGGWIELGRGEVGMNGVWPETLRRLETRALQGVPQGGAGTENKR